MKSTLIITTKNEIQGVTVLWPIIPFEAFEEVLVIDLHSSDGTREFIKRAGICIVDQEIPGRGEAIRLACRVAGGDALVFFAPDGNEDPNDLVKLRDLILLLLQRIGSRFEINKLASELSISRETIYTYLAFLEQTYFISLLPKFTASIDRQAAGSKKLFLCDAGIANALGKISQGQLFEQKEAPQNK